MIVKTFIGNNQKEIESQIEREMGPEAIILLTQPIEGQRIEVTVGIEEADLTAHQPPNSNPEAEFLKLLMEEDGDEEESFWEKETLIDLN